MMTGRIDTHAHLLPGIDDGCASLDESLRCACTLVGHGYTHAFCTPHVWPSLPGNTAAVIPRRVRELQAAYDQAGVPLKLLPGGENNFHNLSLDTPPQQIVTYGMAGRYVLGDLWADSFPAWFEPKVRWLQNLGMTVILAHPERTRAVQSGPAVAADWLASLGVLLQGNLQCFADPPDSPTRAVAHQFLAEGRYFMLGTDLHRWDTLASRLEGLAVVRQIADEQTIRRLMIENPAKLMIESDGAR